MLPSVNTGCKSWLPKSMMCCRMCEHRCRVRAVLIAPDLYRSAAQEDHDRLAHLRLIRMNPREVARQVDLFNGESGDLRRAARLLSKDRRDSQMLSGISRSRSGLCRDKNADGLALLTAPLLCGGRSEGGRPGLA